MITLKEDQAGKVKCSVLQQRTTPRRESPLCYEYILYRERKTPEFAKQIRMWLSQNSDETFALFNL